MLKDKFKLDVGYSGHEVSVSPSVIAATLGACAIERHITLDRSMYGSDQSASLELMGLIQLVRGIRVVEKTLQSGERKITNGELEVKKKLRWFEN